MYYYAYNRFTWITNPTWISHETYIDIHIFLSLLFTTENEKIEKTRTLLILKREYNSFMVCCFEINVHFYVCQILIFSSSFQKPFQVSGYKMNFSLSFFFFLFYYSFSFVLFFPFILLPLFHFSFDLLLSFYLFPYSLLFFLSWIVLQNKKFVYCKLNGLIKEKSHNRMGKTL